MAATERVKLWSKFNPEVDQDTVKAQFLRRVHSDRLKPQFKLKPLARDRAQIPPMVQHYYKNPRPLMTALKQLHRVREVGERKRIYEAAITADNPDSADEDLEIIHSINKDINMLKAAHGQAGYSIIEKRVVHVGNSVEDQDSDIEMVSDSTEDHIPEKTPINPLLQSLQEKVSGSKINLSEVFKEYQEQGKLKDLLQEIQRSVGGQVMDEGDSIPRPKVIPRNKNRERHSSAAQNLIRSRAVLTPIQGTHHALFPPRPVLSSAVQMRYRKLTIGTLHSNDLRLEGQCREQSEKHAIIFYDEFTRSFELINYSEHGTQVNGHWYSLDFGTGKKETSAPVTSGRKKMPPGDVREMVTEIIDRKRGVKRIKYGSLTKGTE